VIFLLRNHDARMTVALSRACHGLRVQNPHEDEKEQS
jgi:hypothetical protein